jgi:hypothetical protein
MMMMLTNSRLWVSYSPAGSTALPGVVERVPSERSIGHAAALGGTASTP